MIMVALVILVLIMLSLSSGLLAGCGGSAPPPQSLPEAPDRSAVTALSPADGGGAGSGLADPTASGPLPQTGGPSSLHERVMAEQGRLGNEPPADRQTIAAAAAPTVDQSETTATTAGTPPLPPNGSTTAVLTGGQTPLEGLWGGTADRLASFLLQASPSPRFTVSVSALAEHYVHYSAESGLRADLLWAQMLHETGYGMYGGDVLPEQNNYAGIGATGSDEAGAYFSTAEAGVMAHVAHMVAYVYTSSPVTWANATTDPRFDMVLPRGIASVLADLNGRWAVPGPTYGEAIEGIARAINAG